MRPPRKPTAIPKFKRPSEADGIYAEFLSGQARQTASMPNFKRASARETECRPRPPTTAGAKRRRFTAENYCHGECKNATCVFTLPLCVFGKCGHSHAFYGNRVRGKRLCAALQGRFFARQRSVGGVFHGNRLRGHVFHGESVRGHVLGRGKRGRPADR